MNYVLYSSGFMLPVTHAGPTMACFSGRDSYRSWCLSANATPYASLHYSPVLFLVFAIAVPPRSKLGNVIYHIRVTAPGSRS